MRAATIDPVKVPLSGLVEVASTALVEAALAIWTAKLRTGPAEDKAANGSRIFNAAAVIASVEEDSAVVASGAADSEVADDN